MREKLNRENRLRQTEISGSQNKMQNSSRFSLIGNRLNLSYLSNLSNQSNQTQLLNRQIPMQQNSMEDMPIQCAGGKREEDRVPTFFTYWYGSVSEDGSLSTSLQGPHTIAHVYNQAYLNSQPLETVFEQQIKPYSPEKILEILETEGAGTFDNLEKYMEDYRTYYTRISKLYESCILQAIDCKRIKRQDRRAVEAIEMISGIMEMHPYGSYGWGREDRSDVMKGEIKGKGEGGITFDNYKAKLDKVIDIHANFKNRDEYLDFLSLRLDKKKVPVKIIELVLSKRNNLIKQELRVCCEKIKELSGYLYEPYKHLLYRVQDFNLREASELYGKIPASATGSHRESLTPAKDALLELHLIQQYHSDAVGVKMESLKEVLGETWLNRYQKIPRSKSNEVRRLEAGIGFEPEENEENKMWIKPQGQPDEAQGEPEADETEHGARETEDLQGDPPEGIGADEVAEEPQEDQGPGGGETAEGPYITSNNCLIYALVEAFNRINDSSGQRAVDVEDIRLIRDFCGVGANDMLDADNDIVLDIIRERFNIENPVVVLEAGAPQEAIPGIGVPLYLNYSRASMHFTAADDPAAQSLPQEETGADQEPPAPGERPEDMEVELSGAKTNDALVYAVYVACRLNGIAVKKITGNLLCDVRALCGLLPGADIEADPRNISAIRRMLKISNVIAVREDENPPKFFDGEAGLPWLWLSRRAGKYTVLPDSDELRESAGQINPQGGDRLVEKLYEAYAAAQGRNDELSQETAEQIRQQCGVPPWQYMEAERRTVRVIRQALDITNEIRILNRDGTTVNAGGDRTLKRLCLEERDDGYHLPLDPVTEEASQKNKTELEEAPQVKEPDERDKEMKESDQVLFLNSLQHVLESQDLNLLKSFQQEYPGQSLFFAILEAVLECAGGSMPDGMSQTIFGFFEQRPMFQTLEADLETMEGIREVLKIYNTIRILREGEETRSFAVLTGRLDLPILFIKDNGGWYCCEDEETADTRTELLKEPQSPERGYGHLESLFDFVGFPEDRSFNILNYLGDKELGTEEVVLLLRYIEERGSLLQGLFNSREQPSEEIKEVLEYLNLIGGDAEDFFEEGMWLDDEMTAERLGHLTEWRTAEKKMEMIDQYISSEIFSDGLLDCFDESSLYILLEKMSVGLVVLHYELTGDESGARLEFREREKRLEGENGTWHVALIHHGAEGEQREHFVPMDLAEQGDNDPIPGGLAASYGHGLEQSITILLRKGLEEGRSAMLHPTKEEEGRKPESHFNIRGEALNWALFLEMRSEFWKKVEICKAKISARIINASAGLEWLEASQFEEYGACAVCGGELRQDGPIWVEVGPGEFIYGLFKLLSSVSEEGREQGLFQAFTYEQFLELLGEGDKGFLVCRSDEDEFIMFTPMEPQECAKGVPQFPDNAETSDTAAEYKADA